MNKNMSYRKTMVKKIKIIIAFIIFIGVLLLIPNMSKAATEYTYSDTEQGIEWSYELDDSGNAVNLKCETTTVIGAVTIPSSIDGKTVTSLRDSLYDGAFEDCAGLTAITIPNTITTIGNYAFYNCTGLKTVAIPNSVTKIGNSAFRNCSGLTSITLSEKLTSIGNYAFANCTGLKIVIIPNSVTTIGASAFYKCSGMTELTLSNSLTKIADRTFEGCTGLTSVILPDSVTTIEGSYSNIYGAFGDCTNLTKILIPDSVASIGVGAFQGCSKLTIYGNDGMTSKQYAEENSINFDYIANWDKEDSGADITPPTVESIMVTYASVMNYNRDANKSMYMVPAGAKLTINVNFSEAIEGTTVPTLTIKFGDGENIKVTEGTIGGSTITYIYTVKSTDKGTMTTVSLTGGNVKDGSGNTATLSCPALKIQYSIGDFVYANGTATNTSGTNNSSSTGTSSGTNNGSTTETNSGTNNGTTTGTTSGISSTTNSGTTTTKDTTTATGKLPQTGLYSGIITILIAVIGIGIVTLKKYRNLRDI